MIRSHRILSDALASCEGHHFAITMACAWWSIMPVMKSTSAWAIGRVGSGFPRVTPGGWFEMMLAERCEPLLHAQTRISAPSAAARNRFCDRQMRSEVMVPASIVGGLGFYVLTGS